VELLRGNTEAALAGLEQAIEAGWREYYVREHDPVWARLATEPRYRASMERVKADVDRQRAEFERTAPASEVLAQIDAGIEAATPGSR
jgi:hypothetical protein